jgi:hypothetical protein
MMEEKTCKDCKWKVDLFSNGNVVSSHTIDTSNVDTAANDELVDRLLVEYANKPKSNVEVKIS